MTPKIDRRSLPNRKIMSYVDTHKRRSTATVLATNS